MTSKEYKVLTSCCQCMQTICNNRIDVEIVDRLSDICEYMGDSVDMKTYFLMLRVSLALSVDIDLKQTFSGWQNFDWRLFKYWSSLAKRIRS